MSKKKWQTLIINFLNEQLENPQYLTLRPEGAAGCKSHVRSAAGGESKPTEHMSYSSLAPTGVIAPFIKPIDTVTARFNILATGCMVKVALTRQRPCYLPAKALLVL